MAFKGIGNIVGSKKIEKEDLSDLENLISKNETIINKTIEKKAVLVEKKEELVVSKPLEVNERMVEKKESVEIASAKESNDKINEEKNKKFFDILPLGFILNLFDAKENDKKQNLFNVFNTEIAIKENKWFDILEKKGNINAITLTKFLLLKKNGLTYKEMYNNDELTKSAMDLLESKKDLLSEYLEYNKTKESVVEKKEPIKNTNNTSMLNWKQLSMAVNNIPLDDVMGFIGASRTKTKGEWKVWETGNKIQITGNVWKNWSGGGGGGAIGLLMDYWASKDNINIKIRENSTALYKNAVNTLAKEFGKTYDLSSDMSSYIKEERIFEEPFCMPYILKEKLSAVKNYLYEKRSIPKWIIEKQVNAGFIFAGYPSDWRGKNNTIDVALKNPSTLSNEKVWAVFLSGNGTAAEMRAIERTDEFAKIIAKGSVKDDGGFVIKAEKDVSEKTVMLCEAGMDSMSAHAIFPGRVVMSCMGVNFNLASKAAVEALEANYKFSLGFDNDWAGNLAAVKFQEKLISELGELEYKNNVDCMNIKFFELGITTCMRQLKAGEKFYFDAKNIEDGNTAIDMFQNQLIRYIGKNKFNEITENNLIKYVNLAPISYDLFKDNNEDNMKTKVDLKVNEIVDLLKNKNGTYFNLDLNKDSDMDTDELNIKTFFINRLKSKLESDFKVFKNNGTIIENNNAIAKDWNDYLKFRLKNEVGFSEKVGLNSDVFIGTEAIVSKKNKIGAK